MASLAFAVPILPGKTEDWKRLARELAGPRRAEYEAMVREQGGGVQRLYLQQTPQGDLVIAYLESDDVGEVLGRFGQSQSPFAQWLRQQLMAIHGVDFSQPLPGPVAEQYVDLRVG
jgi:hypothetical protein